MSYSLLSLKWQSKTRVNVCTTFGIAEQKQNHSCGVVSGIYVSNNILNMQLLVFGLPPHGVGVVPKIRLMNIIIIEDN